jgi:hypothetical protein
MTGGGGFCDIHGPYDPPHRSCPFCALEGDERQVFGPPQATRPSTPSEPVSPAPPMPELTEVRPLDAADELLAPDDDQAPDAPDAVDAPGVIGAPSVIGAEAAPADDEVPGDDEPSLPLGWLVVKEPVERRGVILPVHHNEIIGRQGDVQWYDPRLSRQHARVTVEPAEDDPDGPPVFHLWPFAPTNPVFINGVTVRGATPLHENDEIRLGDTLFVFKVLTD